MLCGVSFEIHIEGDRTVRGGIQKKGNRYYAVIYDGIDPGTGKKRRRWVPAGTRRSEAEKVLNDEIKRRHDEGETLRDQLGEPEDIAEALAFLASPAARNITGHVLECDGGGTSHVPGLAGFRSFFEG